MLVTIQSVSEEFTQSGDEYLKVKGVDAQGKEVTKNVFSNLQDKWGLLQENATVEFKMEKKGQFWNVVDILNPNDSMPTEPKQPMKPPRQRDEPTIDEKNRSFALSYAKDIIVAGISTGQLEFGKAKTATTTLADSLLDWMNK